MINEKEIVAKFLRTRSEEDFLALYKLCMPQVYGFAECCCDSEPEVKELLQEMWVIVLRKLPDFEFRSSLKTWLIGILINLNRNQSRKKRILNDSHNADNQHHTDLSMNIDLKKAISELPQKSREVFVLHDIMGYKHREIGELLAIAEGTSKSQLSYARKALRSFLTSDYNYYEG